MGGSRDRKREERQGEIGERTGKEGGRNSRQKLRERKRYTQGELYAAEH